MEKLFSSLLLVTLFFAGFPSCNNGEDVNPPVVAEEKCRPTRIPSTDQLTLLISYTHAGGINKIQMESEGQILSETWKVTYDNQNRVKELVLQSPDGRKSDYYEIEYGDNSIQETYYFENEGTFIAEQHKLYTLNNEGEITKLDYFLYDELGYSEEYEYDRKGNIIKATLLRADNGERSSFTYEYDDKVNPYKLIGFVYSDDGLFSMVSQSENNVISIKDEAGNIDYTYNYQYNKKGLPVARSLSQSLSGTDPITLRYSCL